MSLGKTLDHYEYIYSIKNKYIHTYNRHAPIEGLTFSIFKPIKACKSVTAHNNELIFGVGNGPCGCNERAGCVAFHVITSLIVTVSGLNLQDMNLMILNEYAFDHNFI